MKFSENLAAVLVRFSAVLVENSLLWIDPQVHTRSRGASASERRVWHTARRRRRASATGSNMSGAGGWFPAYYSTRYVAATVAMIRHDTVTVTHNTQLYSLFLLLTHLDPPLTFFYFLFLPHFFFFSIGINLFIQHGRRQMIQNH